VRTQQEIAEAPALSSETLYATRSLMSTYFDQRLSVKETLFVRTWPLGFVAVRQHELLHALPRIDLARVEIAHRVYGDSVDPMKVACHAAVVSDGTGEGAGFAVVN